MFKWTSGRQKTGYEKISFIEKGFSLGKLLGFDLHLIRYPSYGIDVSPEELIYFEEISDFSWADSLIIYRKDNILYSIEDETVIAVSEDGENYAEVRKNSIFYHS